MLDLHIHTNNSDGTFTVEEVLKEAEKLKLSCISITDHESCKGHEELKNINVKEIYSGKIITGIELKNYYQDRVIDILGYNVDLDKMVEYLDENYKDKTHRKLETKNLKHFYKQAEGYGLMLNPIEEIEWNPDKDWASVGFYNEMKKHPENERKVPPDLWESFSNFKKDYVYNRKNMFFLDKKDDYPSPTRTVQAIHNAGGIAVLAHVYEYKWVENQIEYIKKLIGKSGLDGIECYYSNFTDKQRDTLLQYAEKNKLCISGGTDFHGKNRKGVEIGIGRGNMRNPRWNFKNVERNENLMNLDVKKATRQSYGEKLAELGKINKDIIVFDADLSGATKTSIFAKEFPNRFYDMGISEQDMFSTAAGMATFGKTVFASTFAMFASGRGYDQIRNSICYPKLNVKICATHCGVTVGEDGATHQMLEDINLTRGLPNMTVMCTSDDAQTKWAVEEISKMSGPVYLRLCRLDTPLIYEENKKFQIGKGVQTGEGTDATVFATGVTVSEAIKAQEELKNNGIDIRVVDIHTIKPIDKELIIKCAKETKKLICVEDHSIIGGLRNSYFGSPNRGISN